MPSPASPLILHAGPLRLAFNPTEGSVRYVCAGDREVLRGIAAPVRDQAWSTVRAQIEDLQVDQRADAFRVTFVAHCREGAVDFRWHGTLTGTPEGRLEFGFDGEALADFERNRIGFCILHPSELSGSHCRVEHLDGRCEDGVFPGRFQTGAPFTDIRALTHEVAPGLRAEVRMEGETFEMEDQRNWSDASYKTYCTTLRLPRPVRVPKGTRLQQRVCVTLLGPVPAATAGAAAPWETPAEVTVSVDPARTLAPMPELGVTFNPAGAAPEILAGLRPRHLRVNLWLKEPRWPELLAAAAAAAAPVSAALELAVIDDAAAPRGLASVLVAWQKLSPRPPVARWILLDESAGSTPPALVSAARTLLADSPATAPVGGGACDNFTELNYGPEVAAVADFTVHSVNPQVHAFDEASIVETLAMHGLGVDNARQLSGGKAVVVSPVMFTRRWRTNDTGAPAGPANVLPFQSDPRLDRQCVAAWTLGSIAQLARHGAASATYFETGGENGLVGRDGRARPITDALALVRDFTGCPVHASASSHPWYVEALAVRLEGRLVVVLANLRGETVRVRLTSGPAVRSLELPPYALLRVEPA